MKMPKRGLLWGMGAALGLCLISVLVWAAAGSVTYQYDEAGRLKTTVFENSANRTYTLDAAGNRTTVAESLGNGVLALSVASSVSEGAGSLTVTVTRTGSSAGAVGVSYATANGTAVAGSDFTTASGTLSWANGNSTAQTFSVPILNDTTPESSETFTITLSAPTGGAVIAAPAQCTITITDNDDGTAPSVPTGLSGSAVSTSQVNLTWSASTDTGGSGLAGYKIYRNGVQLSTSPTTSFSDTGVTTGSYTYNVAAYDNAGNTSAQSSTITVLVGGSNSPILTVGQGYSTDGWYYVSGYQLSYPGWSGTVGSISPTTDSTGKTYQYIEDYWYGEYDYNDYQTYWYPAGSYFAFYVPSGVDPGASYLTSVNVNSVTKTGASAASYYWDATNNIAQWWWSDQFGFGSVIGQQKIATVTINPPETTPPSAPGTPSFSSITGTTATVSWSAATDNVGVTAYEYSLNGGAWTSVGNVLSVNLSGLSGSTNFSFAVHAKDAAGNTGTASSNSFATLDSVPPTAPGTPSFSSITATTATASWSAASDNVGVTAYEYSLNGGAWTSVGNVLSINMSGLTSATMYTLAVRAKDAAGNTGTASSNSFTTLDNVAPSAPGTPSFSSITATTATASWSAASDNIGVTGYRYRLNGGSWNTLGNVLTVGLTGLSSSTSYSFDVQATDAAGNWGASGTNSFTTTAPVGSDTPTMTVGASLDDSGWYQVQGYQLYWPGYPTVVGAINPTTDSTGKTYQYIEDEYYMADDGEGNYYWYPTGAFYGTYVPDGVDPGSSYLTSVTVNGVTRTGATATAYTWFPNEKWAQWWWTSPINFSVIMGQQKTVTVVHQ